MFDLNMKMPESMSASPEFVAWLKAYHHPELTYYEVWQESRRRTAEEICEFLLTVDSNYPHFGIHFVMEIRRRYDI